MRSIAVAAVCGLALELGAGCTCEKAIEGVTDDMVKMIRASAEISTELKVQAHVGVSVEQGGRVVTVKLQRPPADLVARGRPRIEAIVRKHIPGVREVRITADF